MVGSYSLQVMHVAGRNLLLADASVYMVNKSTCYSVDWRLIYSSVVTDEEAVVSLDISTTATESLDARNHAEKTIEIKFPTKCGIPHGTTIESLLLRLS
jgi:hypothetical protein